MCIKYGATSSEYNRIILFYEYSAIDTFKI